MVGSVVRKKIEGSRMIDVEVEAVKTERPKKESKLARFIEELNYDSIGADVCLNPIDDDVLDDVIAVCRRAFKKNDVILLVNIDPDDEDYSEGLVFTDSTLFVWDNGGGKDVRKISYDSISDMDYDETSVTIDYEGKSVNVDLGEYADEEKYPRYLYNFVMDIVDFVKEES